jgi:hypothetical protein
MQGLFFKPISANKKGPKQLLRALSEKITGVQYGTLFSYPSVDDCQGSDLRRALQLPRIPVNPTSPFSSGFHAPDG